MAERSEITKRRERKRNRRRKKELGREGQGGTSQGCSRFGPGRRWPVSPPRECRAATKLFGIVLERRPWLPCADPETTQGLVSKPQERQPLERVKRFPKWQWKERNGIKRETTSREGWGNSWEWRCMSKNSWGQDPRARDISFRVGLGRLQVRFVSAERKRGSMISVTFIAGLQRLQSRASLFHRSGKQNLCWKMLPELLSKELPLMFPTSRQKLNFKIGQFFFSWRMVGFLTLDHGYVLSCTLIFACSYHLCVCVLAILMFVSSLYSCFDAVSCFNTSLYSCLCVFYTSSCFDLICVYVLMQFRVLIHHRVHVFVFFIHLRVYVFFVFVVALCVLILSCQRLDTLFGYLQQFRNIQPVPHKRMFKKPWHHELTIYTIVTS